MDKYKIFKQKNLIVGLAITVFGGIFIYTKVDFLNSIGSILLISGIYTVVESYYLKKSLVDMVIEKVKLDKSIDETGLIEVGANLGNIHYQDYFKEANLNIDILHIYARTWTTNNFDFIKEIVLNKKCELRIVLLNPDSPFVPALENHFGYQAGELRKYITEVTAQWKGLAQLVNEKRKYFTDRKFKRSHKKSYGTKEYGSVELFYNNGQPTNCLYRIDDIMIMVNTKTSKDKSIHIPYSIYKNNKSTCSMYNIYLEEINKIIEQAQSVNLLSESEGDD